MPVTHRFDERALDDILTLWSDGHDLDQLCRLFDPTYADLDPSRQDAYRLDLEHALDARRVAASRRTPH